MKHLEYNTPWWWDILKIFVMFYIIVWLISCTAGVTVTVRPAVPGDHDAVVQEVLDVLDFIREREDLDKRTWEQGLRIDVTNEHLGKCGDDCVILGLYWHLTNQLQVWWNGGTCQNALVHELYHRVSYMRGYRTGMFGGSAEGPDHGDEFQDVYYPAINEWIADRACIWENAPIHEGD